MKLPENITYIGAFLTFRCRFGCDYCINRYGELGKREELTAQQWIEGLNRLELDKSKMVPITLQGGEPSMHPGWLDIINGIKKDFYVDLLTNMDFNIIEFMRIIPPTRLQRNVPYASIRASYHQVSSASDLVSKVVVLKYQGYHIGIWAVEHPESDLKKIRFWCKKFGIDFRIKEFLGWYQERLYGLYRYTEIMAGIQQPVNCKTTELLIAPDGNIHRCHRDLYEGINPVANILDDDLRIEFKFRKCTEPHCNPCDIKVKNNRFQEFGACSVEIQYD